MSVVCYCGIAGRLERDAIGYAMGARLEYILIPVGFGFGDWIWRWSAPIGAPTISPRREIAWTGAGRR